MSTVASFTLQAMRSVNMYHIARINACGTFEYRTLCASMSSSAFLDAMLFIPIVIQMDEKFPEDAKVESKEICFDMHRAVKSCASMSDTPAFPRFFDEFKVALEHLITFLMQSDNLSREEVITTLSAGLPASI